jgi:Fungal specific transcription factor domain
LEGIGEEDYQQFWEETSRDRMESLFLTYFTCIHPIWPVLYKPLYASITLNVLTGVLPKGLMYAIFAIASCIQSDISPSPSTSALSPRATNVEIEPSKVANRYVRAAMSELQRGGNPENEISMFTALKPSIPSCQILTLLALQQHGVAEFASAGILCSLAGAMAVELRLHRNTFPHDDIEKEVASRLWWNIYILDKMLASEMGRPIVLMAEECDAPYPSVFEADEYEISRLLHQGNLQGQEGASAMKLRTISVFHTTINLTKILEKIMRDIYSLAGREALRQDMASGDDIRMALSQEIKNWERSIEAFPVMPEVHKEPLLAPPSIVTNFVVCLHTFY